MNWPVLPFLLPLGTALIALLWGRPSVARRWFVAGSAVVQLGLALGFAVAAFHGERLILGVGGWASQLGIVLVIDLLAAVMLSLSSLTALVSILYGYLESRLSIEHPLRLPLVQFMLAGINLSFCTGDLFNLFVAFEIMLIASYALLTLEVDNWEIKETFPYVAINLFGSVFFICACGLAYALFGSLNFAVISERAAALVGDPRLTILGLVLLVVFGIKAGLFPLYFWLPNSYPTLPIPLAALFGGMLTKVGVYVLLRLLANLLPPELTVIHQLLMWLAAITMLLAVLGAISRNFIRGILSYHILSQIGFMLLAIGLFTPTAFAATVFYITHHIVVKSSLFLIGGVAAWLNRSDDLDRMGNLWERTPWLGVIFLLQALSLAGIPPLSGFWGKYLIVRVGLEKGEYLIVLFCIVASFLTIFSMLKIWNGAFWNATDTVEVHLEDRRWKGMAWVSTALVVVSLSIGLGAEGMMRVAQRVADQSLDRGSYNQAVLAVVGKETSALISTP
ncbi:MAG TPA: proton-conducting transporter membrane subunit [Chthoniobacteraceae bacterium]|nr:proton-conducting transporter membrane subunit [Chthoniobacteraceae bacterium]